ncbi:MAG: DUF481 domain-containing protein [Saprospiraceae bacterium]|nr:DUF481 domain-containing protein [Saprospiraceae bacterium]
MKKHSISLGCILLFVSSLFAQNEITDQVDLHINCNACDMNYLRQELGYVNHVRDQALADVELFVNRINNGGGNTYELTFSGKNGYEKIHQELTYNTPRTMTSDEVRSGLLKYIEAGLVSYLMQSGMDDALKLSVTPLKKEERIKPVQSDSWNYWIFDVRAGANIGKESNQSNTDLNFGFNGERVTEEWRIRNDVGINYTEKHFNSGDDEIVSVRKNHYWSGGIVKSLGDHWSAGVFGYMGHNTYNNIDLSYNIRPAVEYNVFPTAKLFGAKLHLRIKLGMCKIII